MILYYSPGACSLADHIALHEAGMKFDLVKVDLKTHKLEDGRSFTEINPKGYVPALQFDDGEVLTENVAILSMIADKYPALMAPGQFGRYRLLEMLAYISTEIHKSFKPLFSPDFDRGRKDESRRPDPEKTRCHFHPAERTVPVRRKSYCRRPVSVCDVDVGDEKRLSLSGQSERIR